jgi:hypothetical protein
MTVLLASKEEYNQRLAQLKAQQQACSKLLIECITIMESNPDYTERLMAVMNQVETMMAQNSRLIARMETSVLNAKR